MGKAQNEMAQEVIVEYLDKTYLIFKFLNPSSLFLVLMESDLLAVKNP